MIYLSGPGHGGPAVVANTYLEGTYSEVYPDIGQDEAGLRKLSLQFSFPGGIPSHASPECPGSIHEGGELGYSLSHAFGAVFDNPAGAARDRVALEQVPRPRDGRRAADPPPQWLQDREPEGARAHHARGVRAAPARLRVDAFLRRGVRARAHARGDGIHARRRRQEDQGDPGAGTCSRRHDTAVLADDRPRLAEGGGRGRSSSTA